MYKYFDLIHYKKAHHLFTLLKNKNHPHILIHGSNKINKLSFIQTILNDMFINEELKKNESYVYNSYSYLFNCELINNDFINILKKIINGYNYFTDNWNYILLHNFHNVKKNIQENLRVIIERSYTTCRFIIISDKYNKVMPSIISRCCSIRLNEPTFIDKYIYFKIKYEKKNIHYDNDILKKKCNSLSFYEIENNLILPNVISNILDKIFSKKISIAKVREICFKLKEITIPNNELLKKIMIRIIDDQSIIDLKKYEIIDIISEYDKLLQKAYRNIIYLESLFIRILNIIHN